MRSVFVPVLLLLPAFFGAWLASAGGRHAGGGFWQPHWVTRSSFPRVAALDSNGLRLGVTSTGHLWAMGKLLPPDAIHTVLRQSVDNGSSWATKTELVGLPVSFTVGGNDNLYVLTKADPPELKLRRSSDEGAAWTEIAVPGPYSSFAWQDIAVSPDGATLYLAGIDKTESSWHWIVAKSADAGASWTTQDRFTPPTTEMSKVTRIAVNWTNNTVWVLGTGYDAGWNERWYVRKSADAGTTWSTSDNRTTGVESKANDIAWDSSGTIYVVGYETESGWDNSYWTVTRSTDEGATWTTVDYHLGAGNWSEAAAITIAPSGTMFVAGSFWRIASEGDSQWAVRKSADGTTWETVDSYQRSANKGASASDLALLGSDLLVIGMGKDADDTPHWVVKRSEDQGAPFELVEDYAPEGPRPTMLGTALMNPAGALFITGSVSSKHGFLRKSLDGGLTWSEDLDPSAYNDFNDYIGLELHPLTGALYALGQRMAPIEGVIRKSADGGATWSEVATVNSLTNALHISATGDLYLMVDDPSLTPRRWVVRRSQDDGQSWATVDDYANTNCIPRAMDSGPGGFFAIGTCETAGGPLRWTVRKSVDGTTWSLVDNYLYAAGKSTDPRSVTVLADGVVLVSGGATDAANQKHALIRRSTNGGVSWSTVDDHLSVSGSGTTASRDFTVDGTGTVYVAGHSRGTPGVGWVRASADGGVTWRSSDRFSPGALLSEAYKVVASPVDAAVYAVGTTADTYATRKALIRRLR